MKQARSHMKQAKLLPREPFPVWMCITSRIEDRKITNIPLFIMLNTKSKQQTKIPKPYTAYMIYWRLERLWILQEKGYSNPEDVKTSFNQHHSDPLELQYPRPSKYKDIALPPYWYSSVHQQIREKHRKHRKQEGSISKSELTTLISKSWHHVEPEIYQYCTQLAEAEKQRREKLAAVSQQPAMKAQPTPHLPVLWSSSLFTPKQSDHPVLLPHALDRNPSSLTQEEEVALPSNTTALPAADNSSSGFITMSFCSSKVEGYKYEPLPLIDASLQYNDHPVLLPHTLDRNPSSVTQEEDVALLPNTPALPPHTVLPYTSAAHYL